MRFLINFLRVRPWWVMFPWVLMVVEGVFTIALANGWWTSKYFTIQHEDFIFKIDMLMAFINEGLWQIQKTIRGD